MAKSAAANHRRVAEGVAALGIAREQVEAVIIPHAYDLVSSVFFRGALPLAGPDMAFATAAACAILCQAGYEADDVSDHVRAFRERVRFTTAAEIAPKRGHHIGGTPRHASCAYGRARWWCWLRRDHSTRQAQGRAFSISTTSRHAAGSRRCADSDLAQSHRAGT